MLMRGFNYKLMWKRVSSALLNAEIPLQYEAEYKPQFQYYDTDCSEI